MTTTFPVRLFGTTNRGDLSSCVSPAPAAARRVDRYVPAAWCPQCTSACATQPRTAERSYVYQQTFPRYLYGYKDLHTCLSDAVRKVPEVPSFARHLHRVAKQFATYKFPHPPRVSTGDENRLLSSFVARFGASQSNF